MQRPLQGHVTAIHGSAENVATEKQEGTTKTIKNGRPNSMLQMSTPKAPSTLNIYQSIATPPKQIQRGSTQLNARNDVPQKQEKKGKKFAATHHNLNPKKHHEP